MNAKKETSSERKWWPLDWVDELMPPAGDSPNSFLFLSKDGKITLGYPPDFEGVFEDERKQFNKTIAEGDIVEFFCSDDFGEIEVTIKGDGTFEAHGTSAPEANWFWVENSDVGMDSLEEVCGEFARDGLDHAAGARVTVFMTRQSMSPQKCAVGADGQPRFETVSAAQARQ
jgi:hypothetical protein